MIEKKTIVDQIEVARDGTIQIRLGLQLLEDGNEISCRWHRTAVPPGGDLDAQLALVDAHLQSGVGPAQEKFPAIDKTRIGQLKKITELVHTPDAIEAHAVKVRKASREE